MLCAVCCALCVAGCVLCAVRCVLHAVCCVLCALCRAVCVVGCVVCVVRCVMCVLCATEMTRKGSAAAASGLSSGPVFEQAIRISCSGAPSAASCAVKFRQAKKIFKQ